MNQQTALAERAECAAPAPTDSAAIISVIERAALSPDVDVSKMERLLEMQERIMDRNAKAAFTAAQARMQPELPAIQKRGEIENKGRVQSTYGRWEDIDRAIRPILTKHGFSLSFRTERGDGVLNVTAVLSHVEGHSDETTLPLPFDGSGNKNAVQGVGSTLSYGKRYTAGALLNLVFTDEDDDGENAGALAHALIDEGQLTNLRREIADIGADEAKFCEYLKIASLDQMPASRFALAMQALAAKRAANKPEGA